MLGFKSLSLSFFLIFNNIYSINNQQSKNTYKHYDTYTTYNTIFRIQ